MPAWVDGVNHTLLVRILLAEHRVPDTWGPWLDQVPMYYHFGFHVTAAVLAAITGLGAGQAVLAAGLLWNGALVGIVYLLGRVLWHSPRRHWPRLRWSVSSRRLRRCTRPGAAIPSWPA